MAITRLFVFTLFALTTSVNADSLWQDAEGNASRSAVNYTHRAVTTNPDALRSTLAGAPMEFTDGGASQIALPMPNGDNTLFRVEESPVISDELAAQYPDVKTYRVFGIDDPGASGRIGITDNTFHGLLHTRNGVVYIDSAGDNENYRSYYKSDYAIANKGIMQPFSCGVESTYQDASPVAEFKSLAKTEGDRFTYRIAVAATGEYTAVPDVGNGDANTALTGPNGIMAAINRVNEIYNRDLNIHLNLVSGTSIIYTNAGADPYTNNDGLAMLSQNQSNLDTNFGSGNYDIGHVFSTGGGGIAGLGVVCDNTRKAEGVTGLPNPVGDPFFIDYVAHEIGHQFAGNHTFNGTSSSCVQRSPPTAFEPGSGTTIMAYAGICGSEDIQNNSDATFHAGSIDEIVAFSRTGIGSNCNGTTSIANTAPVVSAGSDYTIPGGTPFKLTGSATDVNGGTLLYQWDEMDTGDSTDDSTIGTDIGSNPLFRAIEPTSTGNERYFPTLSDLMSNTTTLGETLPIQGRTLNFRLTTRDQSGGVDNDNMQVTVDNATGPFAVTQPNTAMTLNTSQQQVIEWEPACSAAGNVNCANVDIQISTDGGSTFNTLLASTPNDGSAAVTITPTAAAAARIKVACSGNIFFDIANADVVLNNSSGAVLTATGNAVNANCGTGSSSSSSSSSSSGGSGGDVEPNNTTGQASSISVPATVNGSVNTNSDLDDFFVIVPSSGLDATFTLDSFGSTSDLDLYLLNASNVTIDSSISETDTSESFSESLSGGATYYVVVRGFDTDSTDQSYRLQITTGSGGGGGSSPMGPLSLIMLAAAVALMLTARGFRRT